MENSIELVETKELPALSIRKTATASHLPQEIRAAYEVITAYLRDLGVSDLGQAYTAYYNTDMQHLDVEMGFVTDKMYPGDDGDINAETIPAGKKVTFIHKGPYKDMGLSYIAATKWMQRHHYSPTGVVYEFYLNSPDSVPESELLTRVEFLIQE